VENLVKVIGIITAVALSTIIGMLAFTGDTFWLGLLFGLYIGMWLGGVYKRSNQRIEVDEEVTSTDRGGFK